MPTVTVKWLKTEIKKNCPPYSKMKKAQLLDTAKNLGVNSKAKK